MLNIYCLRRQPWRFLSYLLIAVIIVSVIFPFTATTVLAIDVPQLSYPANDANTTSITDPPVGVPLFSWSSVTGANTYRLQVDSEIGFNVPITMDITTPNAFYTPSSSGSLFADGEWYWRVRVESPTVGDWTDPWRFTKTWATTENMPTLESPDDGATLAFFDAPDFSWDSVMGAVKYRFQISTAPDFVTTVYSVDTITTTIQANINLANGPYYWRVIPLDNANHLGTTSDPIRSFTLAYGSFAKGLVPELLDPPDYSYPSFTPTFHWTAVEGAEHYRLEYTTEESINNCNFSSPTVVETRQTFYTPTDTLPNDKWYCWHVRAESGLAIGDWSDIKEFQKQWYLRPVLLTPTNLYKTGLYPLYSWTPVPGASRYRIDISKEVDFTPIFESSITANTTYAPQSIYEGTAYYFWKVTPIDGGGETGKANDPQFEYQSIYTSTAPIQIYPLYYYLPNNYGSYTMKPVEDRTVPYPIFMWHRVMEPTPIGGASTPAYRIQVDDYPPYFDSPVWQYDTENTSATPTVDGDFSPEDGQIYWWRVCPLDKSLEFPEEERACQQNSKGEEWWSQIWPVRFDDRPETGLVLPPTPGNTPSLLRPVYGQESVEATPLLEWFPLQGATQYQVEINRDPSFILLPEIVETVNIPAYSPTHSIAQRSLGRTDYGTFYWRVRGFVGGAWKDWSATQRFQITSQSNWSFTTLPGPDNQFLIGVDPADDLPDPYDLTTLFAHQTISKWYFGFNANFQTSPDMTYVIYFDLDNVDDSGAPNSPSLRNYPVTTISAHRPEYAIYIDQKSGTIDNTNIWLFTWDQIHQTWDYGLKFSNIAGANVITSTDYVEVELPYTAIGMSQETGSTSVMVFSVNSDGIAQDSVPADPQVPGLAQLSRFTAVSDHMNLVFPPNTPADDPSTFTSVLPFYWDWPTGSNGFTPFGGSILEVHLDPNYTNRVAEFHINSDTSYFGENNVTFLKDIIGDNIYYWRVQPKYKRTGFTDAYGAWTGGMSFRRLGFTAQNLKTSVDWATPTFSWDMVEGADSYVLQVATNTDFNQAQSFTTPLTSYTPTSTFAQGTYYWRVQVKRYGGIVNGWSEVKSFTLTLPAPTGLTPNGESVVVHYAPTLCWDTLIKQSDIFPYEKILTAWKYRVQVSRELNFGSTYESVDTNNTCWTPTKGYLDGKYYWHVAMIDGNGRVGPYSSTATFTKQYPITTLISPIGGGISSTPIFEWSPVDGAATYVLEVSKFPTYSPLYDSTNTFNTRFTPTKIYNIDTKYYWRVAIKDRDGNQGPFTDAIIIIGRGNYINLPYIRK